MFTESRSMRMNKFIEQVKGDLIVSCQALLGEAMFGSDIMARVAKSAEDGGARAIRANSPEDVAAIRNVTQLPLIGLYKEELPDTPVIITPTLDHALAIGKAGADIIAIDATDRPHPFGKLTDYIAAIHDQTDCLVMADISTVDEAITAEKAGADMVSTTLSGYTPYSRQCEGPDLEIIKNAAKACKVPVLAEGRYSTPEEVKAALANGALAVVVGGSITRPWQITRRFRSIIHSKP
jgi:N-acylglucosamine-6-phosphate 2-epimerase